MTFKVKILPDAKLDIQDAINWYDDKRQGLGRVFLKQLQSRIAYIRKHPLHFAFVLGNVRRASLSKFPFQVYYLVDKIKTQVIIFAVIHSSRNPSVWKRRT